MKRETSGNFLPNPEWQGKSNFTTEPLDGKLPQFEAHTLNKYIPINKIFLKIYSKLNASHVIKKVFVKVTDSLGKKMRGEKFNPRLPPKWSIKLVGPKRIYRGKEIDCLYASSWALTLRVSGLERERFMIVPQLQLTSCLSEIESLGTFGPRGPLSCQTLAMRWPATGVHLWQ